MKNITRVFIVSALASFVLVGCGEDDGPKPATIDCDNPNLTKEQREEGKVGFGASAEREREREEDSHSTARWRAAPSGPFHAATEQAHLEPRINAR